MRNKIPRDAFPEAIVSHMASMVCYCQGDAQAVKRNAHGPSCRVGMCHEYLGEKVSWELGGRPVESPLESAKEMHERYCREVEQFDECNPTDAQEFDAQVKGMVKDMASEAADRQVYARFGQRMREARLARGMTQGKLAQLVGLSRPSIVDIENGRQDVSIAQMFKIAVQLDMNFGDLALELSPTAK